MLHNHYMDGSSTVGLFKDIYKDVNDDVILKLLFRGGSIVTQAEIPLKGVKKAII